MSKDASVLDRPALLLRSCIMQGGSMGDQTTHFPEYAFVDIGMHAVHTADVCCSVVFVVARIQTKRQTLLKV